MIDQERPEWSARPWILGLIGAAAALAVHFLVGDRMNVQSLARLMPALFIATTATLLGFTLERERWRWSIIFSAVAGIVATLILYFNGSPDSWSDVESWRFVAVFLAVVIAAPLFQAARDAGAPRFPYADAHDHGFTNVVIWFAAWIFVGVVFLLAMLLSELFALIKIRLLKELLDEEWFWRPLVGGAFGAAIGVLREQERIVRLIQRVIVAVLAILAPVLAIGLVLFLASLPFTGLSALWDATRSTTPILLSCVIGALILANGVIGNGEETRLRHKLLNYAASALGVTILPLAIIALVSTSLRIGQYGYTPDRLWAFTFVAIAIIFGIVYLGTILWKRRAWMDMIRPLNLKLAIGLCALAMLLALPIVNFNAISTRDQVARLEAGQVDPKLFDWAALRYDFGPQGRKALDALAQSPTPALRREAALALKAENRWELNRRIENRVAAVKVAGTITIVPERIPLPEGMLEAFDISANPDSVSAVQYRQGDDHALMITRPCKDCDAMVAHVRRDADGGWQQAHSYLRPGYRRPGDTQDRHDPKAVGNAIREGRFTIETVTRRQVYLDGRPVGDLFE